jgi:hypothetical protein
MVGPQGGRAGLDHPHDERQHDGHPEDLVTDACPSPGDQAARDSPDGSCEQRDRNEHHDADQSLELEEHRDDQREHDRDEGSEDPRQPSPRCSSLHDEHGDEAHHRRDEEEEGQRHEREEVLAAVREPESKREPADEPTGDSQHERACGRTREHGHVSTLYSSPCSANTCAHDFP